MMAFLTSLLWLGAPAAKAPTAEQLLEAARLAAGVERPLAEVDRLFVSGSFKGRGASAGRREFTLMLPDKAKITMTGDGIPEPWVNYRHTGRIEMRRGANLTKGVTSKALPAEWQFTRTLLALLVQPFPDRPLNLQYAGTGKTRTGVACHRVTATFGSGNPTTLLFDQK